MINKLILGTVQFGLNYGITNQIGQTSKKETEKILNLAKNNGIFTIDTASLYGNSEQVLGEIGINDCHIITKTIPFNGNVNNVVDSFYQSLDKLNVDKVEGLLIHNINDLKSKNFNLLFKKLNELKREGLVKKIGFSIYSPEHVNFLLDSYDFDLIQVPFNVFDSRLIDGGQLQALKNKEIEIHARSIFLQGILLNFHHNSNYFVTWEEQLKKYQKKVKVSGISLLEYALNFVLNIKEIDKVLIGVNSEAQLDEIIKSIKKIDRLDAFPIDDINLLNPSLWKI